MVKGIIEKPLDELDKNFTAAILKALEEKLGRTLSATEWQVFSMPRSLMAYETILDYITDNDKTQEAIEKYVENVVKEYQVVINSNENRK
ncbi:hypothetical protein GCM10027443_17610 [Pontibacter brevis]